MDVISPPPVSFQGAALEKKKIGSAISGYVDGFS